MPRTQPDQQVPDLKLNLAGGGSFDLSGETPDNFVMVVFYRGLHCPMCKKFLTTLNTLAQDYTDIGVSIIAASMNDEAIATQTRKDWGLNNLRIAYGLTEDVAVKWDLYISSSIKEGEADVFCEPGFFLVRPDGRLFLANITNMPWGRPDLHEILQKIPFALERNYPARGVKT
ncbi:MAG: redoxin family protein [Yoonia sp.]|uniref:redoxin family protein n=1 Tax=Yoonia sp. TaxID=2212373 RepID=UPI003EF710BD